LHNFSLYKRIIMKVKIPFAVVFSDLILPYISRNIKGISVTLCVIFIGIFTTLFLVHRYNQKNEAILGQYLSAVNDVAQNDNALALKKFEIVYNSSNGMLTMLSLIQIIDITINEGHYKILPKLLKEILSLNLDATQSLIIYSKALTVLDITKERSILSPERQAKFTEDFANKVKNLKVSTKFLANKNALLIGLGQGTSKESSAIQNELSETVELIK
jgi:hypothetical protein